MNPTIPHKLSLTLTRVIRAPRARVFAAFASFDELRKWLGPEGCHVVSGQVDFRPGGAYLFHNQTARFGKADVAGRYEEIVRDERIRFTWAWRGNPAMESWGEMRVTMQFADHADGTHLTLTHEGLINEESRQGHEHGWNGSFEKLAGCLDEVQTAQRG